MYRSFRKTVESCAIVPPLLKHAVKNTFNTGTRPNRRMNKKKSESHHVLSNPNGGWDIKKSGLKRASGHFDKKKDAVDRARKISRDQGTELVIHKKDGRIHKKDSHGNDPYPPRG